jgi:hypothetical protein
MMKMRSHRLSSTFTQISVSQLTSALFARRDRVWVERWKHSDARHVAPRHRFHKRCPSRSQRLS